MHTPRKQLSASPATRRALAALTISGALLAACHSLLDVNNPNNVGAEALKNAGAAAAIVTGAENSTARALASIYTPYAVATDETVWVGSRDAYAQLDNGNIADPNNEYVDASYFHIGESRWLAEQAIASLVTFNGAAKLNDKTLLMRAYLNGAVIYTTIADMFDDQTISNRDSAGPPVGEQRMSIFYDSATRWLDAAAALGPTGDLRTTIVGMRARAKFSKAIWTKLNPPGATPANPLVSDAGAGSDAAAALALMSADFRYDITTTDDNRGDNSGGGFGFEMNTRVEMSPGPDLAILDPNNSKPTTIIAKDPVTNAIDPAAVANITRVTKAGNNVPMTQVSAREMFLILAENALAAGNTTEFDTQINKLRALNGKVAYTGSGPTRVKLLEWERRINLIFEGRRLNDMYRFGIKDREWDATSTAIKQPGCLFPIPISERRANPELNPPKRTYNPVCKP